MTEKPTRRVRGNSTPPEDLPIRFVGEEPPESEPPDFLNAAITIVLVSLLSIIGMALWKSLA